MSDSAWPVSVTVLPSSGLTWPTVLPTLFVSCSVPSASRFVPLPVSTVGLVGRAGVGGRRGCGAAGRGLPTTAAADEVTTGRAGAGCPAAGATRVAETGPTGSTARSRRAGRRRGDGQSGRGRVERDLLGARHANRVVLVVHEDALNGVADVGARPCVEGEERADQEKQGSGEREQKPGRSETGDVSLGGSHGKRSPPNAIGTPGGDFSPLGAFAPGDRAVGRAIPRQSRSSRRSRPVRT